MFATYLDMKLVVFCGNGLCNNCDDRSGVVGAVKNVDDFMSRTNYLISVHV